jgi:DNA-binding NtrC family response regulator
LLALQNHKIQRLGSSHTQQVDMRVIAASNVPLHKLVASGAMRADFYFRINVLPLRLPSLRERRADIPLLVQDYIARHPVALQRRIRGVTPEVLADFLQYSWPGNVRELQNVLERAIVLTQGPLVQDACLSPRASLAPEQDTQEQLTLPLRQWLNRQEEQYLCRQLATAGGNLRIAATHSGIDPRTFFRKLRRYGISVRSFRTNKGEQYKSL